MNELDLDKIGKFILSLRNEHKMSQNDLAKEVGVTFKAISKWENGGSFPDVLYQRKLCNALGITLDELQDGELNIKKRKHDKHLLIFKRVSITLFCILIPILIFLSIYFITHVNSYQEYQLRMNDNKESNCYVEGIIIESYSKHIFLINSIKIKDYNIQDTDIISIDLYSNNKIIYHTNVIDAFYLNLSKKIDINNLNMKISIIDENSKEHLYNITLAIKKTSINKVKKTTTNFKIQNDNKIINNLKKNKFDKIDINTWQKVENIKNSKKIVNIYFDYGKKIMLTNEADKIVKSILYIDEYKTLDVYIYHNDNNVHTLVEKYSYNYLTKENNCQVGICSTLDEVLKLMKKYISLLNVE